MFDVELYTNKHYVPLARSVCLWSFLFTIQRPRYLSSYRSGTPFGYFRLSVETSSKGLAGCSRLRLVLYILQTYSFSTPYRQLLRSASETSW